MIIIMTTEKLIFLEKNMWSNTNTMLVRDDNLIKCDLVSFYN